MQEQSVTSSGKRYPLPEPFVTLATQNPLEMEGTYPLPEAQLDRFLFKVLIERPNQATLRRILMSTTGREEPQRSEERRVGKEGRSRWAEADYRRLNSGGESECSVKERNMPQRDAQE